MKPQFVKNCGCGRLELNEADGTRHVLQTTEAKAREFVTLCRRDGIRVENAADPDVLPLPTINWNEREEPAAVAETDANDDLLIPPSLRY